MFGAEIAAMTIMPYATAQRQQKDVVRTLTDDRGLIGDVPWHVLLKRAEPVPNEMLAPRHDLLLVAYCERDGLVERMVSREFVVELEKRLLRNEIVPSYVACPLCRNAVRVL